MIRSHITAEAAAEPAAAATTQPRRPGRPRRPVRLAAPAVRPLLGDEHQDALTALSALLGGLDSAADSNGDVQGSAQTDATLRILTQLSSPAATIITPAPHGRVA